MTDHEFTAGQLEQEELLPIDAIANGLQNPERAGDYLRSQADFLQNLGTLLDGLGRSTELDHAQHTFEFFVDETTFHVPESVRFYCGTEVDHVSITLTKDAGNVPLASVEMHFDDGATLYFSRDPSAQPPIERPEAPSTGRKEVVDDADHVYKWGELHEIERIPDKDVAAMLHELTTGTRGDHTDDSIDIALLTSESYEGLRDGLMDTAPTWRGSFEHKPEGHEDRNLQWDVVSVGGGEMLSNCHITYETGTPGRKVAVDIASLFGFTMDFKIRDEQTDQPDDFSPDTGDIMRLQEIIGELSQQYAVVEKLVDPTRDELQMIGNVLLPEFREPEIDS